MSMPKVAILMAIYKPNIKWLIEQLDSLNHQTYDNIELLAWNDYPEDKINYNDIFSRHITRFKYSIFKSYENMGSNRVFEELTKLADSEYVAYCDQDDIWLPEKISVLVEAIKENRAGLLCSDMYVINEKSEIIANSITEVRPHQKIYGGREQFEYLLARNFVTGCTILVKTELARQALPYPEEYIFDWWLAFRAAATDSLQVLHKPLIQYRIHGNNQTGVLKDIYNKQDYYEKHVLVLEKRINLVYESFKYTRFKNCIDIYKNFVKFRVNYFRDKGLFNFINLYKLRYCNLYTTYFELFLPIMPEKIFTFIINQIRKGKI